MPGAVTAFPLLPERVRRRLLPDSSVAAGAASWAWTSPLRGAIGSRGGAGPVRTGEPSRAEEEAAPDVEEHEETLWAGPYRPGGCVKRAYDAWASTAKPATGIAAIGTSRTDIDGSSRPADPAVAWSGVAA